MYFLIAAAVIWLFFTFIFLLAIKLDNYSIVDMGWGPGFVVVAWSMIIALFIQGEAISLTAWFITAAISIWGIRLFWHIGRRNWGKPEDFRYQNMRKGWGEKNQKLKAYLWVFMLQGVLMFIISLAPIYGISSSTGVTDNFIIIGVGAFVYLFGFIFESIGDAQLKKHISNPANKGKLMTSGLWSWTRHPNYFGEAVLWWGIAAPVFFLPLGYLFLISPLVIGYLVRYVSGVPLLEKKYATRADFQEYCKQTSIFVPLPPKRR